MIPKGWFSGARKRHLDSSSWPGKKSTLSHHIYQVHQSATCHINPAALTAAPIFSSFFSQAPPQTWNDNHWTEKKILHRRSSSAESKQPLPSWSLGNPFLVACVCGSRLETPKEVDINTTCSPVGHQHSIPPFICRENIDGKPGTHLDASVHSFFIHRNKKNVEIRPRRPINLCG